MCICVCVCVLYDCENYCLLCLIINVCACECAYLSYWMLMYVLITFVSFVG